MADRNESLESSSELTYALSEGSGNSRGSKLKSLFTWKDRKDTDNDNYEVVGVKDCKLDPASIAPSL